MTTPFLRVTVIGGGLAGMVVARELSRRNVHVAILEAHSRLGGKAGADPNRGQASRRDDHGYHIFPGWYVNTRALLADLGDDRLIPFDHVNFIKAGQPGSLHKLWAPAPRFVWRNVTSGLLPWYEVILAMYAALDLATQHFDEAAFLDRISANGFLRSRFYSTEGVSKAHHGFVLQASAIPHYLLSAMTASQLLGSYFRTPLPLHSMLNDDLDTAFIEPLRQALVSQGVQIHLDTEVVGFDIEGDGVAALRLRNGARRHAEPGELFVLGVPHASAVDLVNDDVHRIETARGEANLNEKSLAELVHLESVPMAGWHVYFNKKLRDIPREHTVLHTSFYESSFIDISQHWPNLKVTVLSLISSNAAPLKNVSTDIALRTLIQELHDFIHFDDADIDWDRSNLKLHFEEQLFLNTVGAWSFRPNSKTRLSNLFIAGDYCRSQADLTCMESTVQSALTTACHILETFGVPPQQQPTPKRIPRHPRWYMALLWWALLPLILLVLALAKLKEDTEPRAVGR